MSVLLGRFQALLLAVWQLMPFTGPRWVEPSNEITRAVYGPYPPRLQREPRNAYEELVFGMPPASRISSEIEWPDEDDDEDWGGGAEEPGYVESRTAEHQYAAEDRDERPAANRSRGAA